MPVATKQDASNFQKGLRGRAEAAEAEVRRLKVKLAEREKELAAAKAEIPLAVLEGLQSSADFYLSAHRGAFDPDLGKEVRRVRIAAEWARKQLGV